MSEPAILVDLDGTITDSAPGIIASYRHALAALGLAPPEPEALRWVVGPPSRRSFPKLLPPEHDVEEAVRLYRARYASHGIFDAAVFPGMAEALHALRALPARLFVCTAKPVGFARQVIEHFAVGETFEAIYGADLDGRFDDKGLLIQEILAREGIDPSRTVMVGDRDNDVRAAARHGIPAIGVLWGYGGAAELQACGAAALCETPADLPRHARALLGMGEQVP